MPQVNPLARELVFKVVYYGPGLGGKTTSLQHVHATTRPEHRGKMVSLATPVDRTLYFDFLPIRVPTSRNMTVRLQLFTVPGQVYYNATRKLVLTGADGVVFVADSQIERADANVESFRNLEENLAEHGRDLDEMPHVFAYNKRDLAELAPIDEMERLLNSRGAPSFATVATSGEGVYEALEAITRAVLEDFDQRVPEHRGLSPSPLMLPEGGLAEALRLVDGAPESWDIPAESAPPRPSAKSDPGFSLPPDEDLGVGEQAARIVLEQGTRPGLPFGTERPIDSPSHEGVVGRSPPHVHEYARLEPKPRASRFRGSSRICGNWRSVALAPSACATQWHRNALESAARLDRGAVGHPRAIRSGGHFGTKAG
ncbi:MAG: GTPase domain-containing protein [Polyangiaceae bacterium]